MPVMVNIQYTTCSFRSSHEPPLELMAFDPGHIYDGKTWETQASKEGGNIPIGYLQNLKLLVLVLPRPVWNGKLEHAVSLSHVILFGLQKKNTKHCCARHRLGSSGRAITARFADRTRLSLDERAQTINSEKRPTKDDCTETFPLFLVGQAFFRESDLVLEGVFKS